MKLKTTYIALAIYIGFIFVAHYAIAGEEVARSILMGALLIGGTVGGFIDGKSGIRGVGISTAGILLFYLIYNLITVFDPFFIMGVLMLLFFQAIYLFGWAIGYKALR